MDESKRILDEARARKLLSAEKGHVNDLTTRILTLEKEIEVLQALGRCPTHYKIESVRNDKSEATAVMVASDWHIDEVVREEQVSGLNVFNETICRERIARFFRRGLGLVHKEAQAVHIHRLILALLGDFISGSIHEELMEGNRILPVFAIIEAQEHLISGIRYLLENSDLNLVIPCASGNHARFTQKQRISTEAGNSLERLLYHSLAQVFANEPRIQFVISNGYHTYVKVYETVLRLHHGHAVRYNGGVGGITIPLNKAVAQWDIGRRASIDVIGHWHQFLDGGKWIANGSLIGYSAYALSIKATPEPPRQAFFLIDEDFGKTVVAPILLERERG